MNQIEDGVRYMARQTVETTLETKLMARCGGLKAYGFINLLENLITRPGSCGYYMKFDESTYALITRLLCLKANDEAYVRTIIRYALDIGYYDLEMFKKFKILTNRQIQENVFMVYNNSRKNFNVNMDYVLGSVIPTIKEYKKFQQFFEQNNPIINKRNETEQNVDNTFNHNKKDNCITPPSPNSFLN